MKKWVSALLALGQACASAATLLLTLEFPGGEVIRCTVAEDAGLYYALADTEDLTAFSAIQMKLGTPGPVFEEPLDLAAQRRRFFQVAAMSVFDPRDTDGDGIDDVYELLHPDILDALDPTDAHDDPDGNGLTHLQEYLINRFGDEDGKVQIVSAETSVLVGPAIEVPGVTSIESREVSVQIGPVVAVPKEAEVYSQEVSVLIGPAIETSGVSEVHSLEVSVHIETPPP